MSRRAVAGVVIALLVAVVVAWGISRGQVVPPRGASEVAAPRPETSIVTVPVELRLSDLAASLEQSVPRVFFEQVGQEVGDGVLLDAEARRDGPISVRASRGALVAEIPVAMSARAYSQRKAGQRAERGRGAPSGTQANGRLVVQATIAYTLTDDWGLRSETRLAHTWTKKPTATVGPFKVGLQRIADQALAARWPAIAADIDARTAADTRLRDGVAHAWTDLGTARRVNEVPPTWWIGEPEALYATSPVIEPDAIRLVVGLAGRYALVVGEPGPARDLPPLPPRADPPGVGAFRVALATHLDWGALAGVADSHLRGTTWTGSAGTATVLGVDVYPSQDRIVLAIAYDAAHAWKTSGTLYVSGRPVLDAASRELRFADARIGLDTWDDATATAGAIAGSTLGDVLDDRLRFQFGAALDETRTRLEATLGQPTDQGDVLSGSIDSLEIRGVRLTDEVVVIDATATGTLSLRLAARAPAQP